jgi:hypothetical protein
MRLGMLGSLYEDIATAIKRFFFIKPYVPILGSPLIDAIRQSDLPVIEMLLQSEKCTAISIRHLREAKKINSSLPPTEIQTKIDALLDEYWKQHYYSLVNGYTLRQNKNVESFPYRIRNFFLRQTRSLSDLFSAIYAKLTNVTNWFAMLFKSKVDIKIEELPTEAYTDLNNLANGLSDIIYIH